MTLEELKNDKQAELSDTPYYDVVNYSGLKIIGMYHDVDEKVIVQTPNGKITLLKIRYPKTIDRPYFLYCNTRYHIDEFLK